VFRRALPNWDGFKEVQESQRRYLKIANGKKAIKSKVTGGIRLPTFGAAFTSLGGHDKEANTTGFQRQVLGPLKSS